jgi:hypothetical protein
VARRGRKSAGIEGFAEDLGRLLGTAQAKAQGWIGQRHTIAKQLQQIRDTAAGLLSELTNASPQARRRGRRQSAADQTDSAATGVVRRTRRLSAKARKAISDAQKRRWAAVRAAKK